MVWLDWLVMLTVAIILAVSFMKGCRRAGTDDEGGPDESQLVDVPAPLAPRGHGPAPASRAALRDVRGVRAGESGRRGGPPSARGPHADAAAPEAPTRDAVIMRDQVREDVRARLVRQQEGRREQAFQRKGF
jgi:hypothetical protein